MCSPLPPQRPSAFLSFFHHPLQRFCCLFRPMPSQVLVSSDWSLLAFLLAVFEYLLSTVSYGGIVARYVLFVHRIHISLLYIPLFYALPSLGSLVFFHRAAMLPSPLVLPLLPLSCLCILLVPIPFFLLLFHVHLVSYLSSVSSLHSIFHVLLFSFPFPSFFLVLFVPFFVYFLLSRLVSSLHFHLPFPFAVFPVQILVPLHWSDLRLSRPLPVSAGTCNL